MSTRTSSTIPTNSSKGDANVTATKTKASSGYGTGATTRPTANNRTKSAGRLVIISTRRVPTTTTTTAAAAATRTVNKPVKTSFSGLLTQRKEISQTKSPISSLRAISRLASRTSRKKQNALANSSVYGVHNGNIIEGNNNNNNNNNTRRNDQDNINMGLVTRSEKTVMGTNSFDGIEVTMKSNGMELLHVMGARARGDLDVSTSTGSSPPHPLAYHLAMDHTTTVHYANMSTTYHPACRVKTLHRVPTTTNRVPKKASVKDMLAVLDKYLIVDEETAVGNELVNIWNEMKAIENDRLGGRQKPTECFNCRKNWDIDSYLDGARKLKGGLEHQKILTDIDKDSRRDLQQKRGAFVHAGFRRNGDNLHTFAIKCGGNPKNCQAHKSLQGCNTKLFGINKVASVAATVRHLAITTGENGSSFFISKDDGRAYCDESIPSRLTERIQKEGDDSRPLLRTIRYLACGPNDSYYAELVSGQVFWGIGKYDEDFQTVMDSFNIHRVSFGSFDLDAAWIVISKEGQVAWRHVPRRLHFKLKNRTAKQVRLLLYDDVQ